jgi:hypothetical protein
VTDFAGLIRTLAAGGVDPRRRARAPLALSARRAARPAVCLDAATITRGLNFTLTTELGDLDVLGEVTGGGGIAHLRDHATPVRLYERDVYCLDLDWLIRVERAAGPGIWRPSLNSKRYARSGTSGSDALSSVSSQPSAISTQLGVGR